MKWLPKKFSAWYSQAGLHFLHLKVRSKQWGYCLLFYIEGKMIQSTEAVLSWLLPGCLDGATKIRTACLSWSLFPLVKFAFLQGCHTPPLMTLDQSYHSLVWCNFMCSDNNLVLLIVIFYNAANNLLWIIIYPWLLWHCLRLLPGWQKRFRSKSFRSKVS